MVGCEKFRFAYADDEMMMNAEAGLYFKFDVDQGGIPINCPGLENFNMETWIGKNGDPSRVKDTERRAYHTDCPLNERSLPENDKPVSQIIADYATDQVSDNYISIMNVNCHCYRISGCLTSLQLGKR